MPAAGQVYNLRLSALLGPWKDGVMHPGLVVSRSVAGRDLPWIVVPMTGSKPLILRPTHVLLDQKAGSLDPPLWIECEYPTTVPQDMLTNQQQRGFVPRETMVLVRNKLSWVLQLGFAPPPAADETK